MKIGFIGLGTMGASMALNLRKAGYELVVNDVRRAAADAHLAAGCAWADNAGALARASDVVFTSLPGPKEIETVALGDDSQAPRLTRAQDSAVQRAQLFHTAQNARQADTVVLRDAADP